MQTSLCLDWCVLQLQLYLQRLHCTAHFHGEIQTMKRGVCSIDLLRSIFTQTGEPSPQRSQHGYLSSQMRKGPSLSHLICTRGQNSITTETCYRRNPGQLLMDATVKVNSNHVSSVEQETKSMATRQHSNGNPLEHYRGHTTQTHHEDTSHITQ
eukprot:SAG31_NODE_5315_length_2613_cov_4.737868_2_plen_154_part_00